jgi:hypothetical protein
MAPLIALEGRQEPAGGRVTPAGFTIAPDIFDDRVEIENRSTLSAMRCASRSG